MPSFKITDKLLCVNADLLFIFAQSLILHDAVDKCVERIVAADTYVYAGMNMSASLTIENAAREYGLTVRTLCAEALGFAVSAVSRAADTFFMSK